MGEISLKKGTLLNMNEEDFEEYIKEKILENGIYDVTGLEFEVLECEENELYTEEKAVVNFSKKFPDFKIGSAYQCCKVFLLSKPPIRLISLGYPVRNENKGLGWIGTGFNYGSCNLLTNCPKSILILAEDD